jgi:predicted metalloprotease with PDZ domain
MKQIVFVFSFICLFLLNATEIPDYNNVTIKYEIDLTESADDLFHVSVYVDGIPSDNNIYNFVSNAPGTYSISDFGRFVKSFQAYDVNERALGTTRLSVNRWRIRNPEEVSKIVYTIDDTYGLELDSLPIYPMLGTGIQDDFIVINTFGVLGFFDGMQTNPIQLKVIFNKDWEIGTAMKKNDEGYFIAESFDRLADSPILLGDLTVTTTMVNDIEVSIYTYSSDPEINSEQIMTYADEILRSAGDFIGYSPVPNYEFLFVLLDPDYFSELAPNGGGGALEHSLSSYYFLTDSEDISQLRHFMAHEFLHILTPLHLHSELLHNYNFITPTPSEHIWLYEGVTEWASGIMQLRSEVISLEEYLSSITQKIRIDKMLDSDREISLSDMSLGVFNQDTLRYFYNFYQKGALTALILDVKLLELSNGNAGFRDLYLDLLDEYGKNKPFSEKEFFQIIVDKSYPEIEDFINKYIKGTEPLPIKEYFDKLGIDYIDERLSDDSRPVFGFGIRTIDGKEFFLVEASDYATEIGFQNGDKILKLLGKEVNMKNIDGIVEIRDNMNYNDPYTVTIERNGKELDFSGKLQKRKEYHVLQESQEISEKQSLLRDNWLRN